VAANTLVILNPHAGNGDARKEWPTLRAPLEAAYGELEAVFTEREKDVKPTIADAYKRGLRRVFSVGGDGTSHSVVNAIIRVQDAFPDGEPMVYGTVPVGTGRDWIRSLSMPLNSLKTIDHMVNGTPQPVDVIEFQADDGKPEILLNLSDVGLGGCVASNVNALPTRYPWSFSVQSLRCILGFQPQPVTITVDGELFFDGDTFITAVANGGVFGHGMRIAPTAVVDDGLLDVLTVKSVTKPELLLLFAQVFSGAHMRHPKVTHTQGREAVVECGAGEMALEIDGEVRTGTRFTYRVRPGALTVLR
jgi:diacylglycerol kinase (ATP)